MFLSDTSRHVGALQRGTNMASPYKAIITRIGHFSSEYLALAYGKFYLSESQRVSLHINLLTFLRFFLDLIY